jgi:hypothetical protein
MNTGIGTPEKMTEIPDSGITVFQALYTTIGAIRGPCIG